MLRADWHTHTDKSNFQFRDSTNFVDKLIDKALELNLSGIGITDHAVLSSHVDAIKHLKKLREQGKAKDFKLGLGTEIYLVDREVINKARTENTYTKFYHLILIAKNYDGYRAIAELSSKSWEDSFVFRGLRRIPTYKDYFWEWAKRNAGNVIVSSACLGSEVAQLILSHLNKEDKNATNKLLEFINNMKNIFNEDFYIELQPSYHEEQIKYNNAAIEFSVTTGIKTIITTDAHYLSKKEKELHSIYLKSQNAERETEDFYASTYLMHNDELWQHFKGNMPPETFKQCLENTIEIANKIEEFDLKQDIKVPQGHTKFEYGKPNILAKVDFSKYPYIEKFGRSKHMADAILIQQISDGLIIKNIELTETVLSRINEELGSLWEISEKLHQRTSAYYTLTKEIVELIWKVSLVGVGRGSAGAFYICYLLDISSLNPIEFNIPSWRHVSPERVELAEILASINLVNCVA